MKHISFDKFVQISLKTLRRIVPLMEQGKRYDEACAETYGDHYGEKNSEEMLYLPPIPTDEIRSRIVKGRDALQKHHNRLCANLPQEGSIRCLEVTEKQFAAMKLLLGELKTQEKKVNSDQLLLF